MQKIFVVLKLSAFSFEISSFSTPGCCINFILDLLQVVGGSILPVHLELLEGRGGLNFRK